MDIKKGATFIVSELVRAGYIAYFAGGWVRDYLMEHPSSDIDIATNAPSEKILDLFPHTILVGLAFGVVIVVIEGHHYEVSTFRRDLEYEGGRRPLGIEYSDAREDALRRDFTINGMFYDPLEEKVIDYVGGAADIERQVIRTIGVADERFIEDRLRMIRAVRFATRFGFLIDGETQEAIQENAYTLFPAVAMERVWSEFQKMAAYPNFDHAIIELHRFGLLPIIFPQLANVHLNDIKHRVAVYPHFPLKISPIFYVLELFPESDLPKQLELCQYLKVSNEMANLVEYLYHLRRSFELPLDMVKHVHALAHPLSDVCLEVIAAKKTPVERQEFLKAQRQFKEEYKTHIERAKSKKPLVQAAHLMQRGMLPGKELGEYLKKAEQIAILNNLEDREKILKILLEEK